MQRPTNELKDNADQYLRKNRIVELFEVHHIIFIHKSKK